MKRYLLLAIVIACILVSSLAASDKKNFRGVNLQLSTRGYHDSDSSGNTNWHLSESNTLSLGIKGGHFSKNDRHVFGGGFRLKYRDSKSIFKLSSSTIESINDFFDAEMDSSEFEIPFLNPYMKVEANVFYRYSVLDSDFVPNLKLWLEVETAFFRKWILDEDKHLTKPYTTGVDLTIHPVISYEITEDLSVETSLDVIYVYGRVYYQEQTSGNNKTSYDFVLASANISTFLEAALNIGIVRRF